MKRFFVGLMAALSISLPMTACGEEASSATAVGADKAQVEKWVHEYLVENPEVIVEAMQVLQARQAALEAEQTETAVAALDGIYRNDPLTYVAGNPDGDVTIYEFFDYKCGYCKRALDTVLTLIEEDKGLRFVMIEFPILSEESELSARAALASIEQGNYFKFHRELMHARGTLSEGRIAEIASQTGMDGAKLLKRMRDDDIGNALIRNHQVAKSLDITGTPGFVVGSELIKGAYPIDAFRAAIAEARKAN